MDTASCLKVWEKCIFKTIDSQKECSDWFFLSGQIHKTCKDDFIQDEKSLMWMSAVQDYVTGEPSVTYLQVNERFVENFIGSKYLQMNNSDLLASKVNSRFVESRKSDACVEFFSFEGFKF